MTQSIGDILSGCELATPQLVRTMRQLVAHRLGRDESFVLAFPEHILTVDQLQQLLSDAKALAEGYPAAYLFGEVPFLEWDFLIDTRALIPRPETEGLMQQIIDDYHGKDAPKKILDLCCGSGCMGLSLALAFPVAQVTLTDLSQDALDLCADNVAKHGLEGRTRLFRGDLWQALGAETYDLVISNPPYVAHDDEVENSVQAHEPNMALYSDDQGTAHVKRILAGLDERLNPGGRAAFELGHDHRNVLNSWLHEHFSVQKWSWRVDTFGVWRFLFYDS